MAQSNKYSLLEEISKCSGYDYALMTTFNFDIKFFERAILNPLYARGLKKITVFVDDKEFSKSIKSVTNCHMGRKYMVNPIVMDGSFHPKLILLLGKKKARLFVGSANLTTSGLTTNNEVFNYIDYSEKNPENIDIICAAIDFFIEVNNLSYKQDIDLIREAVSQKYYRKPNQRGDCIFVNNTKTSILKQLTEYIDQEVNCIKVIVPYYDQQLKALTALKTAYPDALIHTYIYKYLSTFPEQGDDIGLIDSIEVFEGFNDNNSYSWNNFYHGKVFLFECANADYVLYGSANCTQSALVKSKKEGGNIECGFLERGESGEFDYFVDNLCISDDAEYTSSIILYDKEQEGCFTFKFGKFEEEITLHFKYRNKHDALEISVGDSVLNYSYENSELIVNIPPEVAQYLTSVFDVQISYLNSSETIRCWVFNPAELDSNRYSTLVTNELDGVDIDSSGDKYAGDYTKIINAMNSCVADIEDNIKKVAMRNVLQLEAEGSDVVQSEEGDEFIVEDTISDEDRFEYRRIDAVDKLRKQFLKRFSYSRATIFGFQSKKRDELDKGTDNESDPNNKRYRKATTAEKRFERFVKRRVKEIFNPAYLNLISVEHYIVLMEIVIEVFRKYNNDDPVEDIFDKEYVIKTRIEFYRHLLEKDLSDTEDIADLENTVVMNCLTAIIENKVIDGSIDTENANRSFLNFIDSKYNLRETFGEFVKRGIDSGEPVLLNLGFDRSCDYIDMLYGYKSTTQLEALIDKYYKNALIDLSDQKLSITAEASDVKRYAVPSKPLLTEIAKYSQRCDYIKMVVIEIKNGLDVRAFKNIWTRIKHTIRMDTHLWTRETVYKNGSTDRSKPSYYDY